uniref:Uncharacterized protein n=1 Tax=Klebsiella pneumoniae TaxID=573 RepID=A0A6M5ZZS3_KLEPN|nr:hypothetical protein [Klebsiella pneumoniae]
MQRLNVRNIPYSPRMRGLSEQFEVSAPGRFVFPPHAGVIGRD